MIFLKQTEQDIVRRNKRVFFLTNLDATALIVPVIVILWLKAELSFSEMLLLQGLFAVTILLFEVPSGALADSFSRKGCALLYQVFFGIGLLLYSIGNSFEVFAIGEMLAGVGVACKTGADSTLIYDTLKNENRENEMRSILATAQTLSLICAVLCTLL
ncbi:MAG: MFS transporter, partial [Candidatus Hodarchaeota archaeon]